MKRTKNVDGLESLFLVVSRSRPVQDRSRTPKFAGENPVRTINLGEMEMVIVELECECGSTLTITEIEFAEMDAGVYGPIRCIGCKKILLPMDMESGHESGHGDRINDAITVRKWEKDTNHDKMSQ